jgi:hypothetical protein
MIHKPFRLYTLTVLLSSLLNMILLIIVCNALQFDYKSAICVYLFGVTGFFVKAALFFLLYFLFYDEDYVYEKIKRRIIIWAPALMFFLWFFAIIFFQMESFFTDISYGYLSRLPHFYFQLISVLITCLVVGFYANKTISQEDDNEILINEDIS